MALRVWLPLNGSLENKGISDYEIRSANITIADDGKIGKCYNFNGSNSYINITNFEIGNNWSYGCWINTPNSDSRGWEIVMILNNSGSDADSQFAFWVHQKENRFESLANTQYVSTIPYTNYYNNWHHFFATFNGALLTTYIDGNVVNTKTITATQYNAVNLTIGARSTNATGTAFANWFQGKLNDIRVYDHCLSPLEVKEISQGLVLHYKLDSTAIETSQNLVTTEDCFSGATCFNGATSKYGYGTNTDIYKTTGEFQGRKSTKVYMGTAGLDAYPYVYFNQFSASGTTVHTLSFDYFPTSQSTLIPYSYNGAYNWTYIVNGVSGSAVNAGTCPALNVHINQWNHIEITAIKTDTTNTSRGIGYVRIGSTKHTSTTTDYWLFANVQIEEKDHATIYMGVGGSRTGSSIIDSSGYGNNGEIIGDITTQIDSPRFDIATYLNSSSPTTNNDTGLTYIRSNFGLTAPTQMSVCWWAKPENGYGGSTNHGAWCTSISSSHPTDYNSTAFHHRDARFDICLNSASTTSTYLTFNNYTKNEWHYYCVTYDGKIAILYKDGVETNRSTISSTEAPLKTFSNIFIGYSRAGGVWRKTLGAYSDFRIYATALSAEDILDLYHTPANIDNLGEIHGFEFVEDDGKSIGKNGIVHTNNICQINDLIHYCQYDNALYFEPDGSAWMHIYHHNNPGGGSFASTDTFSTGVYKDENRWFDGTQVCNSLTRWEFLIKYKFTSTGTEYKERWIQSKNPEEAVYGDVDAADITRITTGGYKTGTWGGLYKKNNSAYWVMNNGNSGNWWGATCSFSVYQSGTPGYGGTVTTTGVNDLYIRIDNLPLSNFANASITKDGVYKGNNFIEK